MNEQMRCQRPHGTGGILVKLAQCLQAEHIVFCAALPHVDEGQQQAREIQDLMPAPDFRMVPDALRLQQGIRFRKGECMT